MPKESRAHPLCWPPGHARSEKHARSKFRAGFPEVLGELQQALRRQRATGWFVSSNYPVGPDGFPDTRWPLKDGDPGAALYWVRGGSRYVMACDAWETVADNLHAIFLTLEADRAKVRWGCSGALERSQAGFLELPGPPPEAEWWTILSVPRELPIEDVRAIYRLRIKQWHPDQARSEEDHRLRTQKMKELNAAIEAAEREASRAA